MGARRIVLRPLTEGESSTLEQRLREKRLPAKIYERYRIIDLVRDGMTPAAASRAVGCSDGKAEHWVHRFNDSGFTSFEKQPNHPGRPIMIDSQQVRSLIRVALSRPEDLGLPFTQWSVSKLKAYCLKQGLIPPITDEWVRRLLRREGVSYQHTKTWKESNDPNYEVKKNAVLDLYEQCPENGAVICFDECGPLELRPLAGKGWFRSGHPQRFRATYRRLQGTEQLLAFYDVHADCLVGQVRKHKRVDDLLAVFARLRACYPMDVRLYVVMDNLNTHKHARLKAFMAGAQHRARLHADLFELAQRHRSALYEPQEVRDRGH